MRILAVILLPIALHAAEIIPSARLVDWTNYSGVLGGIPTVTTIHTTLTASGGDDTAAFDAAIGSCPSNQVIKLNDGVFTVTGLDYFGEGDGIVIRGSGPRSGTNGTLIKTDDKIYIRPPGFTLANTTSVNLSANAAKGDTVFTVAATPSWAKPGVIVQLNQRDNLRTNYISHNAVEDAYDGNNTMDIVLGEGRASGQINRITATNATTITLETPTIWDYLISDDAQITQPTYALATGPIQKIGFEDFTIEGTASDSSTDMFFFENAVDCWVRNVTITNMIGRNGIRFAFHYRANVENVTVTHSHQYGSGAGYGIAMYNGTSGVRIENSIFNNLHIGVELSYGSTYTVLGYNYFKAGQADSFRAPAIAGHAVHNAFNLYEGNWCIQEVTADITHGSSSHGTIFRNRIDGVGTYAGTIGVVPLIIQQYNRAYSVVGNVLGRSGTHTKYDAAVSGAANSCGTALVCIELGCEDGGALTTPVESVATTEVLRELNLCYTNVAGVIKSDSGSFTVSDLRNSYYLTSKPAWWTNANGSAAAWPAISPAAPTTAWNPAYGRDQSVTGPAESSTAPSIALGGRVGLGGRVVVQ